MGSIPPVPTVLIPNPGKNDLIPDPEKKWAYRGTELDRGR
jgi:hypothetical protein